MASKAYNGWSGEIRDIRGTIFYNNVEKSKKTDNCSLCGDLQMLTSLSWHAEEYGSTWMQYLAHCYRLCPRCHGMIHHRFNAPNLWARYVHKVRMDNFGGCHRFPSLMSFFGFVRGKGDIEHHEWKDTGIDWVDALPRKPYKGPTKIACEEVNGVLVPDRKIYKAGYGSVKGVIMNNQGVFEEYEYYE